MIGLLLVTIFFSSALSMISYFYCWHDIKTGHPHIISLRQITNIMDRNRLNEMFGKPNHGYRYHLEPAVVRALVRSRQFFFHSEVAADSTCMVGAYLYLTDQLEMTNIGWFLLLGVICQAINVGYSIWLVRKWSHQIKEEMDNLGE
jgi:hypothetical protein